MVAVQYANCLFIQGTGFSGSFKVETAAGKKAAAAKKGAKPAEKGKGEIPAQEYVKDRERETEHLT